MDCRCFFFNDTATTEIYTLSLHDALPILPQRHTGGVGVAAVGDELQRSRTAPLHGLAEPRRDGERHPRPPVLEQRSEEHTSELQSRQYLVCRLLLEKKTTSSLSNSALTSL